MLNDEVIGIIAVRLWRAFEYTLPVSPRMMSKFVIEQINEAGFEIVKGGTE